MSSGTRDPDEAPTDEYSASQEEIARQSDTGGDAPAAASMAEREALARGDEPFFTDVEASDADTEGKRKTAEGGR